jgi:hypothetical protein
VKCSSIFDDCALFCRFFKAQSAFPKRCAARVIQSTYNMTNPEHHAALISFSLKIVID